MSTYEITSPDGSVYEVTAPEGASEDEILAYAQSNFEQPAAEKTYSKADAGLMGAYDTLTFGGGDELAAAASALPALFDGDKTYSDTYAENLDLLRDETEILQEEQGGAYLGGQIAGAFMPGAAALSVGNKLPAVAKLGKYARTKPFRTAAITGGVSGGVYGFGSGEEGAGQRAEEALYTGGLGAAAGPIGAHAAQTVGGVVSPLVSRAQKLLQKPQAQNIANSLDDFAGQAGEVSIRNNPGAEAKAIQKIKSAIKKDFPENSEEVFDAWLNGDKALIESYGSQLRTLGQGAAQYKSGKAVAQKYFDEAIPEAPEKMKASIAKNISGVENYYKTVDEILESGRARASKFYDKAYEDSVSNTEIFKIPEIQKALDIAYKKYPSKLKEANPQSIKTLDYAKRVLDDEISKALRTGERGFAKDRIEIKEMLVSAMDEASPAYKKARGKSGDYLKVTNSMEAGKKFMSLDPEQIVKAMKNSTDEEKIAFKIGVGKQLRDKIDAKIDGSNPYNAVFGSKTQRARLAKILSPDEFQNLEKSLKAEKRLFDMRNEILGGSPTAGKQQAAVEIAGGAADALNAANGNIQAVPRNAIIGALKKMADGLSDDTAEQVSRVLYTTDPSEKIKLFTELSKKVTKDQYRAAQEAYFGLNDIFGPIVKQRFYGASMAAPQANKVVEPYSTVTPSEDTQNIPYDPSYDDNWITQDGTIIKK